MPVWGARLVEDYPQGQGTAAVRKGTVTLIVDHLDTIQVH